ncbi:MAG: hypothetical protein GXO32_01280 [Crenarchaeota archaeon]|nr:hypothetical protein [Thermoproteota archaeon]
MAHASAKSIAEKLREPESAGLLAVAILVYDLAAYRGEVRIEDVVSRCLFDRSLALKLLSKLESMGVVKVSGSSVRLTTLGKKAIEVARWGREL